MDWFRSQQKFQAVRDAEAAGEVADSMEVRKALMARHHAGELSLVEVQIELVKIKHAAKEQGKITRAQAFRRG